MMMIHARQVTGETWQDIPELRLAALRRMHHYTVQALTAILRACSAPNFKSLSVRNDLL